MKNYSKYHKTPYDEQIKELREDLEKDRVNEVRVWLLAVAVSLWGIILFILNNIN